MYDSQGKLTRAGAEQVIREGGSVFINGRHYAKIDNLPSDADFAAGDPNAEEDARGRLQKQIAAAQAELTKLGPRPEPTDASAAPAAAEGGDPNAGKRRYTAGKS